MVELSFHRSMEEGPTFNIAASYRDQAIARLSRMDVRGHEDVILFRDSK